MENSTNLQPVDPSDNKGSVGNMRRGLKYFFMGLFFLGIIGILLQIFEVMDSYYLAVWLIGWFLVMIPTLFLAAPGLVKKTSDEPQTLGAIHNPLFLIYVGIGLTFLGSTFLQGCICTFFGGPPALLICLLLLVNYQREAIRKKISERQQEFSTLRRDIAIGLCVFIYSLLTALGIPWYLAGRLNVGTFILTPPLPWIELGLILLVLLLILRIGGDWKVINSRLRRTRTLILVLCVMMIGISVYCCPGISRTYLQGFREWVRQNVDVPDIQAWMKTAKFDPETSIKIEDSQWPAKIKKVNPWSVWLGSDRTVKIHWGWREFYYGVAIFQAGTSIEIPSKSIPIDGGYVWLQ